MKLAGMLRRCIALSRGGFPCAMHQDHISFMPRLATEVTFVASDTRCNKLNQSRCPGKTFEMAKMAKAAFRLSSARLRQGAA